MAFNMFANSTTKDYYKVLNLSNNADRKDIRAAYHELALRYHPDKTGGDALALCQFQAVQEAFDILGNPDSKSEYDQSRAPAAFNQAADEENADEDIDQMIWDGWQAPFNGQKSSLFYQSTGCVHTSISIVSAALTLVCIGLLTREAILVSLISSRLLRLSLRRLGNLYEPAGNSHSTTNLWLQSWRMLQLRQL